MVYECVCMHVCRVWWIVLCDAAMLQRLPSVSKRNARRLSGLNRRSKLALRGEQASLSHTQHAHQHIAHRSLSGMVGAIKSFFSAYQKKTDFRPDDMAIPGQTEACQKVRVYSKGVYICTSCRYMIG